MIKIIIAIILLSLGCSSTPLKINTEHKNIDIEFQPYVEHFQKLSKNMIIKEDFYNVSINFADIPRDLAGTCWVTTDFREIEIDRDWWRSSQITQLEREELMLHEFGHCLLFRSHVTDILKDGCPVSYMYPDVVDEKCIKKHYKYYIKELFDYVELEEIIEEVIIEEK